MRVQNNFKKGAVEMLLLHLLKEKGDCYGYQMSQLIKNISAGYLIIPEGSMYPALYKLIKKGYITDYKKQVGKRMVRVYYHIEAAGEERLSGLIQEYYETNKNIEKILGFDFCNENAEDEEKEYE